jgi:hypothetical protein
MMSLETIAEWLFERMGLDAALTGDLLEERRRGRSLAWYWRQVLFAVCAAIWNANRNHKVDAFRVLAMGFAMNYLIIFLWAIYGFRVPDLSVEQWAIQALAPLISGVLVAWLIADREHPVTTVALFATCNVIWYMGRDLFWVRMLMESMHRPMFRPDLVMYFMTLLSYSAGLAIGVMMVRPRKPIALSCPPW